MSNPSTESLTQQDLEACLAVVHRYASESLAPLCERHEQSMAAADMRAACLALETLGVLHSDQTPAMGIWDEPGNALAREWSWRALRELGRVNAGVAVQVHAQAVAWHLDRCAGQAPRANGAVVCSGFMGLGRDAVVADLADQVLSTDQVRCLADNWGLPTLDQPRYLFSLPDWEWVWLPVWTAGQQWTWVQWSRDMVDAQALPQAHGLDELTLFALSIKPQHRDAVPRECRQITGAAARQAWVEVQAMQVFGGMGYMQDNGMEKTLRDLNVLRLMGGAPAELRYILAYWDALSPMLGELTA